ncbi:virulence factor MviM [Paraliobacillus quinghaiensis]|uniref:Virulence factor MviM n=1 Tax=Paraliobacillus quinghaiensis TaxID=470815 RepID=A0A917TJU1_9BACI|nr:Gfo/Idh/MocA family oxidoreductase [Paraliobacillus quinghaiensis]GGM25894.1 virulence factor MviM [Paraliobacillus quinghaiensis]
MTTKVRVGIVGLGGIAQKAYLPILSNEKNWSLVGAYTPNKAKRAIICENYRMQSFDSLESLSKACDAVFVHSTTETHYQVVSYLLDQGLDVYVDKPLAANLEDASRLVEKSEKLKRILMVGFNRRFAPVYLQAKELAGNFDSMHIEKHRPKGIGPASFSETMLDDYLHLVDTVRWFATDDLEVRHFFSKRTKKEEMIFANHTYESESRLFSSRMHRQAGVDLEKLELTTDGGILSVTNMRDLVFNKDNASQLTTPGSWQTVGDLRGFEGAINHFIDCIERQKKPDVDGYEALKSQQLLQDMVEN